MFMPDNFILKQGTAVAEYRTPVKIQNMIFNVMIISVYDQKQQY